MKFLDKLTLAAPCALMMMGSFFVPKTLAATFDGEYTVEMMNDVGGYERIGSIKEYSTTKTLEEFYNYGDPTDSSIPPDQHLQYNGPDLGFTPDQLHLFMVHSTTTGEIGLFSVNGDPNNNNGDRSYLDMTYQLIGEDSDKFEIAVADENIPDEAPEVFKSSTQPNLIYGIYAWAKINTDGAALSIYDDDGDYNWHLEITLENLRNNLGFPNETMYFLSADGNSFSETNLENGTVFRIIPDDENNPSETIPEPSNFGGLFIFSLLVGGLTLLKKK